MAKKTVNVNPYVRSKPGSPAWNGDGKKPGPKTVEVDSHKRSKPSK